MALQAALASPTNVLLERNWSDHAFKVLPIESLLTIAIVVFSSLISASKCGGHLYGVECPNKMN